MDTHHLAAENSAVRLLNAEGKKEAVKQVELADRQIELLTEIPKYRKPDNEE